MKKMIWTLALFCTMSCHTSNETFNANLALDYCAHQVERALEALKDSTGTIDYTIAPRNILENDTAWNCRNACPQEWCSGFWPGILWMTYSYTQNEDIRQKAKSYTEALGVLTTQPVFDHDLGFLTLSSYVKGYEATQNPTYKEQALRAADSLATLFNSKAGTILSWPRHVKDYGGHNTIMDNMMNLELLFWAAQNGGSQQLKEIATRHAETTMQYQFRKDGGCYHVAVYDSISGAFLKGVTHQGLADSSLWSRGQSWAIYGYTMVYRYTHEQRFLDFAQKVTDLYLKRLHETSNDWVPIWDMDDPNKMQAPKDASAASVVASALLELCQYVDAPKKKVYYSAAENMLRNLSSMRYQSRQSNVAFLMHSTGHYPAGTEIDASIIYADYYYLEALLRYSDSLHP